MITVMGNNDASQFSIQFKQFEFSGGEIQVEIQPESYNPLIPTSATIEAYVHSSNDIMTMLLITDALRRQFGDNPIDLIIPYLPYARQDRVMVPGESLALKVMCDLINAQKYRTVTIWDAHSDVAPALLDRCINLPNYKVMPLRMTTAIVTNAPILVSPDAGAIKKVLATSKHFELSMIRADKVRDVKTGAITGTVAYTNNVGDKDFLIVDDICDGGRTFIELAKVLRLYTTGKIFLYVTHGIFSKGLKLFEGLIDHIYCPNVWPDRNEINFDMRKILN